MHLKLFRILNKSDYGISYLSLKSEDNGFKVCHGGGSGCGSQSNTWSL